MTLAMDFGTCNTVVARWNLAKRQVETLRIGGASRIYGYCLPGGERRTSAVIPSLIHYGEQETLTIGAQVENAGLAEHRGTFRWMKLDLLKGNNRARRIGGTLITPRRAATKLIQRILLAAVQSGEEDLVATLPVEAYDPYADWLQTGAAQVCRGRVRMLDEATACILGYGAHVREGQIYAVFDFGGGTLDVSIVKTLDLAPEQAMRSCIVLGRAGEEIGGALVDQWLLQELQEVQQLTEQDMSEVGTALLHAVEDVKVRLSRGEEQVEVAQFDNLSARLISHRFSAADLRHALGQERETLGNRSLYRLVALTVERALELAQEKYGTRKSEIRAVFMVGGSSLLLGVAELVANLFPDCRVHCENPFEAIARGACRYAGGDINLALVHDYCLRAWDPNRKDYVLVPVVPKGTRYPSDGPISVKYVNAACEGATCLGLVVIERSEMVRPEDVWEVVGGRLQRRETHWCEESVLRELNPADREFIHADPPCTVGVRRFVAGFGVDANKRLTLSLKDLDKDSHSYVQMSNGERLDLPIRDLPFVKL